MLKRSRYNIENNIESSPSDNYDDYAEFMKKVYDIDIDEQNKDNISKSNMDS